MRDGNEAIALVQRSVTQMVQPRDYFVPVSSVHTTKEGDKWKVRIELPDDYFSYSEVVVGTEQLPLEQVYSFVKTLFASMISAEKLIGPFAIEAEQVYINSSGQVRVSTLLAASDRTTGICVILEEFKKIWDGQDLVQAKHDVIDKAAELAETQNLQAAYDLVMTEIHKRLSVAISDLNRITRYMDLLPLIEPFKPLMILFLSTFKVRASVCMHPQCYEGGTDQITICGKHYFCCEKCRNECSDRNLCKLCGDGLRCVCGRLVNDAWRKVYMKNDEEYPLTANFCSNECFRRRHPKEVIDRKWKCLLCGGIPQSDLLVLNCGEHMFCSTGCYKHYCISSIPEGVDIGNRCLFCSHTLMKLAREKKREEEIAPMIGKLDQLRANITNQDAFTVFLNNIYQIEEILHQEITKKYTWPLFLDSEKLCKSVHFLSCLKCKKPAVVHIRKEEEMKRWGEGPFLLKCEVRLHAVCSRTCYQWLRGNCENCPYCGNFALDFAAAEATPSSGHPSLEAIRRTPCECCHCGLTDQEYIPLPSCAHEVCRQCLILDTTTDQVYACQLCQQKTERELLWQLL